MATPAQRRLRGLRDALRPPFAPAPAPAASAGGELRVATFEVDATPPLGTPLMNGGVDPAVEIVTPLSGRGLVLLGDELPGGPIVLCALDWTGSSGTGSLARGGVRRRNRRLALARAPATAVAGPAVTSIARGSGGGAPRWKHP